MSTAPVASGAATRKTPARANAQSPIPCGSGLRQKSRFLLHLLTAGVAFVIIRGLHGYGLGKMKGQQGFRPELDLLRVGYSLRGATSSGSHGGANTRTLAAARNRPNDRAQGSSASNLFGCVFAAPLSLFGPLIGVNRIGSPVETYIGELNGEQPRPFEASRGLSIDHASEDIRVGGDDDSSVHLDR